MKAAGSSRVRAYPTEYLGVKIIRVCNDYSKEKLQEMMDNWGMGKLYRILKGQTLGKNNVTCPYTDNKIFSRGMWLREWRERHQSSITLVNSQGRIRAIQISERNHSCEVQLLKHRLVEVAATDSEQEDIISFLHEVQGLKS